MGGLELDWVYLCQFSSNFLDNWSVGNSLVVRNHLALSVDGGGTVIASELAMYARGEFWWCGGGLALDWVNLHDF